MQFAAVHRHDRLGRRGERTTGALLVQTLGGQVVEADDHILRRQGNRTAVRRLQDVVRGQHQDAGFGLGFGAQRQVYCHLVTVEVGVECGTNQRVQLKGLAFNQLWFERLDAQTVQGRCTVQQYRVLGDDLFENIPNLRAVTLDHALGALDVLCVVEVNQALHHERLEELQGHLLGQTTLVQLQLRADNDDRTAGVVNALAEQVLAETSLLALEHVGKRLQRTVAWTRYRAATTTVVEERVNSFLQHALFVVDDDFRRTKVQQALEAVVAVDDAAVQVVEVGGREAATVQLDHRAQFRRDHRYGVEDHAQRGVGRGQERVDDLEALERTGLLLSLAVFDDVAKDLGFRGHVEGLEALLDGFGAHGALEVQSVALAQRAEQAFVTFEVSDLEVLESVPDLVKTFDVRIGALTHLGHRLVGQIAGLLLFRGLCTLGFEGSKLVLEVAGDGGDVGVAGVNQLLAFQVVLRLEVRQFGVTALFVHGGDHVGGEVNDLLKILRCQVKQVAQARGNALEVPDVGYGGCKLDVTHAFATNLGTGNFNTTAFADDALEAHALVLAAVALPVAGRAEDLFAEKTVLLRLEGAVVDGFGLLNLAVAPPADLFRSCQADAHEAE